MENQTEFEREARERLEKVEAAISRLASRMDAFAGTGQSARSQVPQPAVARRLAAVPSGSVRGADWWLARAGAVLTTFAVILLYRYAIDRGWITSFVRVLTGVAIGAVLMYWGRKMPAAADEEARPVALRELMMGSALAAWYISAFAASVSYHLIEPSTSRIVFLLLSIIGTVLGLRERRSLLAIVAVGAGFLAPVILPSTSPSIPAFAIYLAMIGGLALILYLMRGWQAVLWIAGFSLLQSISVATTILLRPASNSLPGPINLPSFDVGRISLSLLILAMAAVFTRAPSLRRGLVATGSDRYQEPLRSKFALNWLAETGRFFSLFSPAAGKPDSLSMWFITISAPLFGLVLISNLWWRTNSFAWGSVAVLIALAANRLCASRTDENSELTHIEGAAFVVWRTAGLMFFAAGITWGHYSNELMLGIAMISAALAVLTLNQPRFAAGRRMGRAIAVAGVSFVVFHELSLLSATVQGVAGSVGRAPDDRLKIAMSFAELIAIATGFIAWRNLTRDGANKSGATLVATISYAAFLLVDARALGQIWSPLVTATFAIAGTTLLLLSRKTDDRVHRAVGGATLALVVFRLFFVDLAGVDTIWRVVLFLGIGALFLFTSRQLQNDRAHATRGNS
ncbi:MAG: DUF2339 domain-containing protein [Gemmatimonadaceae bacterium]